MTANRYTTETPLRIAVLPGDGIGPEVVRQGLKVLEAFAQRFGLAYLVGEGPIGGAAIDKHGVPLPPATLALAQDSHAVLLGAVGAPQYDTLDPAIRPERGLLQIRKALDLYANLRPVTLYPALLHTSTLKPEVLEGVDLLVVRELTGGLYFGEPKHRDQQHAVDTLAYHRNEIERIAHTAFQMAQQRRGQVCSVDKANVLVSSQLWREVVETVARQYPNVTLTHQYVDNAAMQLIRNPRQYDVLLTENTFGDILSDEASMLCGSLGMLASASLGTRGIALYEPSHGSAPDIAGQDKANPIATVLSIKLLLSTTAGMPEQAQAIDQAINQVLSQGYRTADIAESGSTVIGCNAMGDKLAEALAQMPVAV